jgi:hypothetical protein
MAQSGRSPRRLLYFVAAFAVEAKIEATLLDVDTDAKPTRPGIGATI